MLKYFNFILISLFSLSGFTQNTTILTANNYISEEYNELLFISVKDQKMYHIKNNEIIDEFIISSSAYGTGNKAGSHQKQGWETFTNHIINTISDEKEGVVFLLWGKFAQNKTDLIDSKKHFILKASHPSPFSAYSGFFGCKHFSKTNEILIKNNKKPIDWKLCSDTLTLF